ncbi:microfibril-associated glycoprotein 4-like [Toxorhynchites rutilus septentrionalis]|uniref:microfibril-associated glycoprotein 4-like n=1 Tax=Toxorhynchites rutilus septentrionalis TaxID=329112 RepID=UPI00247843B5|nr:microfibril-associated glycoprotein 4-like [Toxorhynchites rutilus septentrionalis]
MLKLQIFVFICTLILAVVYAQETPQSCSTFGYEILAARLDSLETAIVKSQLKSTETAQNLRSDVLQIARDIQNMHKILDETSDIKTAIPASCDEVQKKSSDVYMIDTSRGIRKPFQVFCDQEFEGGGWTVFQNRYNGDVDFYRSWNEYKDGFGSLDGDFWLGLENIHQITYAGPYELAVVVENFMGEIATARYSSFALAGEAEFYKLAKLGSYNGTAGDSLSYHVNSKFSTFDNDNDENPNNCAVTYIGAWWYKSCHYSNLNSRYLPAGASFEPNKLIIWSKWKGDSEMLKKTRMMVRRTK